METTMTYTVVMEGGRPWGFSLQGGLEFRSPIRVGKVTPNGRAEKAGLVSGDYIMAINSTSCDGLKHLQAQQLVVKATSKLELECVKYSLSPFSPPGSKTAPQFTFASISPPSPSRSFTPSTRSRASSFTSPVHSSGSRSRASSFTSPIHSSGSHPQTPLTASSPVQSWLGGGDSETKRHSLSRPSPPAVFGAKTATLSNGRPKPPAGYQSEVHLATSSSGVSSSVSSTASSPQPLLHEGVHQQFSPPSQQLHTTLNGFTPDLTNSPDQIDISLPVHITPSATPPNTSDTAGGTENASTNDSMAGTLLDKFGSEGVRSGVGESVRRDGVEMVLVDTQQQQANGKEEERGEKTPQQQQQQQQQPCNDFVKTVCESPKLPVTSVPVKSESGVGVGVCVGGGGGGNGVSAEGDEVKPAPEPASDIDRQIEEAHKAREAELKSRAQQVLMGKLGSLVRSKPPLPPSAGISKPPLHPNTTPHHNKSPKHSPAARVTNIHKSHDGGRQEERRNIPVIKPYLVKKGEKVEDREKETSGGGGESQRSMKDIRLAHRMPGWYKEMFQGFQQTVEEMFPDSQSGLQAPVHSRTKSSPADMETYVYDYRGLKVRKSSFTESPLESPVKPLRPHSARPSFSDEPNDPEYVYDYRGLRVRKDSVASSETLDEAPGQNSNIPESPDEVVTTADVLVASRRQFSQDSGYDERGLRLRTGSQSCVESSEDGHLMEDKTAEKVSKEDVMETNRKPTSYKTDKYSTETSRNYWSGVDRDYAASQRQSQAEEQEVYHGQVSSEQEPLQHKMAHMHPLLTEGLEEATSKSKGGNVFEKIDAEKLHGALENAKALNAMEQEGVPSTMLPLQAHSQEQPKQADKLPPPGKKARALFDFNSQNEKELSFSKGAIIDLTHTINENWLEGTLGQTKGIFPSSYVQVLSHEQLREILAKEKAPLMQVRATFDFEPQSEKELKMKKGDIVAVTMKIDDNWFLGYLGDKKGIFPATYVENLGGQ